MVFTSLNEQSVTYYFELPNTLFSEDEDTSTKLPSLPLFEPPSASPTQSPSSPPLPTTSPSTMPSAAPTQPLNCVQTVVGTELTIPKQEFFMKGELHCLRSESGDQHAHFGYTLSNQFGFFLNGRPLWTVPQRFVKASDRWMYQNDGNLLLRNARNEGIWRTSTASWTWSAARRQSYTTVEEVLLGTSPTLD